MGLDSHIPHTLLITSLVQQDQLLSISLGPDCFLFCVCRLRNGFIRPLAAWHFRFSSKFDVVRKICQNSTSNSFRGTLGCFTECSRFLIEMLEAGLSSEVRTTTEVFDKARERHFVWTARTCKMFCSNSYFLQEITFNKNMTVAGDRQGFFFQPNLYFLCILCFQTLHERKSRNCSFWVRCIEKQIMVTPFSRAKSIHVIFLVWELWQLNVRIIKFSYGFTEGPIYWKTCTELIFSRFIQPTSSLSFMLLLGNTRKAGTHMSIAFMQVTTVVSERLSGEDNEPKCHLPCTPHDERPWEVSDCS